ncbi:YgiT-type zinc finger protein [uncultured Thiodictyon sp.]|jgi:YgiT-type zinc finger domain-containing protein|uniref:YgiT-type zinc finger protein n=1 Tax=uncultured Thiodictyon sp. TaxID=1846217 RepID=UPI0025FE3BDD|nr:YgiT-type zinc finger protein [uncultured Thiodictyon sp.]
MNETRCPVCGEPVEIGQIAKAFGRGNGLLVIEDIPMIVCRTCHEQYIAAEALHEIEKLRERRQHQARMIKVERFAA